MITYVPVLAVSLPSPLPQTAVRSLAVGGRYLVVGFASGTIPSPPLNLVLLKEACVIGVFWGAWREREPAARCGDESGCDDKAVVNDGVVVVK